jgi:hypothetical protein
VCVCVCVCVNTPFSWASWIFCIWGKPLPGVTRPSCGEREKWRGDRESERGLNVWRANGKGAHTTNVRESIHVRASLPSVCVCVRACVRACVSKDLLKRGVEVRVVAVAVPRHIRADLPARQQRRRRRRRSQAALEQQRNEDTSMICWKSCLLLKSRRK